MEEARKQLCGLFDLESKRHPARFTRKALIKLEMGLIFHLLLAFVDHTSRRHYDTLSGSFGHDLAVNFCQRSNVTLRRIPLLVSLACDAAPIRPSLFFDHKARQKVA